MEMDNQLALDFLLASLGVICAIDILCHTWITITDEI